jgi:flagellin-like hook-associated protein FlgL
VEITSENTGFQNGFRISGGGAATDERWTTPSVPTGHTYSNDFTRLASDTFSANLAIDFGSWTESGGAYTFSDSDPASSTSLNFTDKTVSEVVNLLEGVNGLTAQLISNADNSSHTVRITSEDTGFQNGFRISGGGAATDERWTTPSVPTGHTYSNDFMQLAADNHGSGILHGPAMVSDEFEADEGDILKLGYNAQGGGDWYHVAAYIVDSGGDITMALNEWGQKTDDWQNLSVEVQKTDDYRFVFVNGTWDQSGGRLAGASMLVDDVKAEDPYTTNDTAVQQLMRSTSYSSSSTNQAFVKDVLITANDSSTSITDTSRIFNTEYEGKIMVAPTLNLEKSVSLGASNDLGPDGSTDHYIVVSKIEEVKSRIDTAKAVAQAQHTVLESAIETATDLRSQLFWGADAISDPEFFAETAYFAKQQMMQDSASAILAQANANQGGLMKLVDSPNTIEA